MSCNGVCERFKAKKIPYISSRYPRTKKEAVYILISQKKVKL
jgi:hypothetical protein